MADIFIITSVINTGSQAWSYISTRSVFTTEERFEQTLQSIESIRTFHKNPIILLIECSDLSDHMTSILQTKVDHFINVYDNPIIRDSCINTKKKGHGEVAQTICAIMYIKEHALSFNRVFKLSGRYYLTEKFVDSSFSNTTFSFKMYDQMSGSTVLYSTPAALVDTYLETLRKIEHRYTHGQPIGLECLLPIYCRPATHVQTLGVAGYVAVGGVNGKYDFYEA
jgi:hypothetical protein